MAIREARPQKTNPDDYWCNGRLPDNPTPAELAAFLEANQRSVARQRAIAAYAHSGIIEQLQAEAERAHMDRDEYVRQRRRRVDQERFLLEHGNDDYDLIHAYFEEEARKKAWQDTVPGIQRAELLREEHALQARMGDALAKKHARLVDYEVKAMPVPFESVKFIPSSGEARFTGYAATYDLDLTGDLIVPGAFKDTLADAKAKGGRMLMPLLFGHDQNLPIGGVVDAHEDAKGLHIEGLIDLDTARGREAYSAAKKEYVSGLSIGYRVGRSEYDRDGHRRLKAITLHEISLVLMPANPAAGVTGFAA